MAILDKVSSLIPSGKTLLIIVVAIVLVYLVFTLYKKFFTTEERFQDMIGDTETVFRMFYVDWCPHCQVAKPEFEKLSKLTEINGKPIKIEMVNAEENTELAKQFNVTSYPTIILTHSGKNTIYEGDRTEAELTDFIKKNVV